MQIQLISPAKIDSRDGNRTTAVRWKNILQSLGHTVSIRQEYSGNDVDLMLALHAWRSEKSIRLFSQKYPNRPLLVALTGTDVHRFQYTHQAQTLQSLECADILIGLHANIASTIPQQYHHKVRVIFQSTETKRLRRYKSNKIFKICIAGHLRDEKDPLRPAYAARSLPKCSRIKISQFGKAHTKHWEQLAKHETSSNQRYRWYGEITQSLLSKKFSQSDLLVLPSRMEGGANIISEAIMSNLPVVASRITGNLGLLGEDYAGYFNVESTKDLKTLLMHCESSSRFYKKLIRQCKARQSLFSPEREKHSWKQLLVEFV